MRRDETTKMCYFIEIFDFLKGGGVSSIVCNLQTEMNSPQRDD